MISPIHFLLSTNLPLKLLIKLSSSLNINTSNRNWASQMQKRKFRFYKSIHVQYG